MLLGFIGLVSKGFLWFSVCRVNKVWEALDVRYVRHEQELRMDLRLREYIAHRF